jgi:hypothetical protein
MSTGGEDGLTLVAGVFWFAKAPATHASVEVIDYSVRAKGSDPFWRIQRKTLELS